MERYHDQLGHLGFAPSVDLVKRRAYWPSMEEDLKEYVKSCEICQLANSSTRAMSTPPLRPIPPVAQPFERIGIDFLQNLPETLSGFKHCITCIDYATRFVLVKPVKNMDAQSVIQFLYKDVVMKFGCPYEIISDRGSSFLSDSVKAFLDVHYIRHLPSSPYHPQTNGMVERMHRELNRSITSLVNTNTNRWNEVVDECVFNLNVRTHSTTKFSAFKLLFGIDPRLPQEFIIPRQVTAPLTAAEKRDWILERTAQELEDLGQNRASAYQRSLRQAHNWTKDQEKKDFKFKIGEMAKRRRFNSQKFENHWTGPFFVVEYGFPFTYWLQTVDGRRLESSVNESHLASWISRDSDSVVLEEDVLGDAGSGNLPPAFEEGDSVIVESPSSQT
jgi:transposase InsO family protein